VAVFKLTHHAEDVALVFLLNLRVQSAGGWEICHLEFAAQVADALAQYVQGAVLADLLCQAFQKMRLHIAGEGFAQLFPFFGLGDEDEIQHVPGDQAQRPVIIRRGTVVISAGGIHSAGGGWFSRGLAAPQGGIRSACQQGGLDGFFKILFRDCRHNPPPVY